MCDLTERASIDAVFASIDAANAGDPTLTEAGPLALVQGQLASTWLKRLTDGPAPELQVAVRAHHLKRWELARADYPAGRAGYLTWRRDNKAHQADAAAAILIEHGWKPAQVDRVRELLGRTRLRTDPGTQTLEDAACLVFLETQFEAMSERTDHDHMVTIVARTLKKMSGQAIDLTASIAFGATGQAVLTDAVNAMQSE